MANQEQLEILKQGVDVWNRWRGENTKIYHPDLNGADRIQAELSGVNLIGANLIQADLHGANLSNANLSGADLRGASLRSASLRKANLSCTNLSRAYLILAGDELISSGGGSELNREPITINIRVSESADDLNQAKFTETSRDPLDLKATDLFHADLTEAQMAETVLGDVDLSTALGLEKVKHFSASILSIRTVRFFKGIIPLTFLRGCGLTDLEIEFAKLANPGLDSEQVTDITYKIHQVYLGGGIQYYSCFISYSSKDQDFAQQLHNDLQNNGVRCWFDREDLKIGDAIRPTIDRQIRLRDKLLVILSENSMKSEWVGDEVEGALEEEQKGNRSVLFPIRLDDTVLNTRDDWAAKIKRRRHIGDFSNWKDKLSYQTAFERLLRDLKATS